MKDLIIIGAGPAGLTAGIYGVRAGLDLILIEKFSPGGQVMNTYEVENYPGFKDPIEGWQLIQGMEGQATRLGVKIVNAEIKSVTKEDGIFKVEKTDGSIEEAKAVIAATGSSYRPLDVPGEKKFIGKGVSYCATCDGAFYKDKITAVVGGGDVALEEADFLTRFAKKVYLIHRRDEFRGAKILQDRILGNDKIEPVYDTIVDSIDGDGKVEYLSVQNKKTGEKSRIDTDGAFIFIGFDANTAYLPKEILDEQKQVIVDIKMKTSIDGLFAAGDLRSDSLRQIVMGAADGATAALGAYDYILNQ